MRFRSSYDVVVLGGGPAGSATAIMLARAGRRVLLAEAVANTAFKIGETLPPSVYPLLRDLGVAERVAESGHVACPGIVSAWGDARPAERDFIREVHGSGWHLDRPRFDADLRTAAAEAGVEVRVDCVFTKHAKPEENAWQLQLIARGESRTVEAPWVVDATGRRALFATARGAVSQRDDELVAFCVVISATGTSADTRTSIEASEEGWWYSARLPGEKRVVAFFTDHDLPAANEIAESRGFARRLAATQYLRDFAGEVPVKAISRVRRFPAQSLSRRLFGGPNWIAVGDATLAFDPLSSQGIFHALYTGVRGAQTVLAAIAGDPHALAGWHERLQAIHSAYRRHLKECYGAETRWADAEFWQRRHLSTPELSFT